MPIARAGGRIILFAHVPKAGGTSVEAYLAARFGPLGLIDRRAHAGVRGTGLITPATHLTAGDLAELAPPRVDHAFAVVRDPLARLLSEHRYQSGVSRLSRLGLSLWIETVLRAAAAEPRLYENHIRPQGDLVPKGAEVFRLEDGLGAIPPWLDAVLGEARPDLVIGHANARPAAPARLMRADVTRAAAFYADDYARFGYAPPDPAAYPDGPRRPSCARALARALVARQRRGWGRPCS